MHAEGAIDAHLQEDLYLALRAIAGRQMRGQQYPSLAPTDLVHEAYLRLERARTEWLEDRSFLAAAAKAMRSVLVDHARARGCAKRRAEGERVPVDALCDALEERAPDLVALDQAVSELARVDEAMARAVELRFFVGLSVEQTAAALDLPRRTFDRHWAAARAWLHRRVEELR